MIVLVETVKKKHERTCPKTFVENSFFKNVKEDLKILIIPVNCKVEERIVQNIHTQIVMQDNVVKN